VALGARETSAPSPSPVAVHDAGHVESRSVLA
jgi:hypothetical protein